MFYHSIFPQLQLEEGEKVKLKVYLSNSILLFKSSNKEKY